MGQYLQFKNSFSMKEAWSYCFSTVDDNSVHLFPGPSVSSLHCRTASVLFLGPPCKALCSGNASCLKAPCGGPFFLFSHILSYFCKVKCLVSSISFLWTHGWSVTEYLWAPELGTNWFGISAMSLVQAMVPQGWVGSPSELLGISS